MFTAFITTNKGAEGIAALEASELAKSSKIVKLETVVKFDFKDLLDLCKVSYKAQAINRAALLLSEFKVDRSIEATVENFRKSIEKTKLSDWLDKDKTFKVECQRHGEHDFHSTDIEIEAGKAISRTVKLDLKTDFDNPMVMFYLYIYGENGFFGVDFSGFELSKRQYKIFNHPESLKGTTGYFLVREAGYDKKKVMLDPFIGSGIIVIEAALFASDFPVQYYNKNKLSFTKLDFFRKHGQDKFFKAIDQLRFLKASQKNAKLAGIEKSMSLSRSEIEWLDTKMEKGSVDLIVTDPPRMSKNKDSKKMEKLCNELFYQAEYILKKSGSIVLITNNTVMLEAAANKHKFKIIKDYTLNQGKEIFRVLTFKRV
jgi:putative N6-adenine-specific DNA methylase